MRCPSCGTENTPDSRFCGVCGAKVAVAESRVVPTVKISDDATFPPSQYGTPVPAPSRPYQSGPASIPPQNAVPMLPGSIPPNTYVAPGYGAGPASIPPQNGPPQNHNPTSIPPLNAMPPNVPGSIPPNTYAAPAPAFSNPYRSQSLAEPSMSLPISNGPRWGLIAIVLLLDVGLAGAGAVLLQKGLAKPSASEPADPKGSASGSASVGSAVHADATAPAGVAPTTAAAPSPAVAARIASIANAHEAAPPEEKTATKPDPKVAKGEEREASLKGDKSGERPARSNAEGGAKVDDKKPAAKHAAKSASGGSAPQDPYGAQNGLATEVELAGSRSKDEFAACAANEARVAGRIDVSFTVWVDGRVTNVRVVQNTTGSPTLSGCLSTTIARWTFATHPTNPTDFVRPFIYN